jgi:hypothetical protein
MSLAKKLLAKRTILVGTIRGNRRELPKTAKLKKDNMTRFSTLVYKAEDCVLTIYKGKPSKKVLALSSKHKSVKIANNDKRIPESISFYNKTKFGVDILDQMARKYTVKAGSRRWPLQVFYNILDLAAINAWILYKETTGTTITRKDFLFQLAEELATEYIHERNVTSIQSLELQVPHTSTDTSVRHKACQIGYCHLNRANGVCRQCKKCVCGKCTLEVYRVCKKCAE